MANLVTAAEWPDIVQKNLSIVFLDQYRDFPSCLGYLYRYKRAEQGTETDLETNDIGNIPAFTGDVTYLDASEGYKKQVSETEYAAGIKVTRRLLRNDLYGVIQDRVRLLAQSFRALRETRGAFPFNNAFNSSFTVGDGLSLCNSAHTSKVAGVATQSNTNSLAFSAANVQASRVAMKKLTTNAANIMVNVPDMLIVPLDLEDKAYEVINSRGKVDVSVNNVNYSQGRYKLLVWDNFLSSTTTWFLVNSRRMKQQLVWRDWEPTQFFRSGETDTLVSKHVGYSSFEVSSVDWRWAMGGNS